MVLNAIAAHLLSGTPAVLCAQTIRGVSRALLVLVNEDTATAQRRTPRRRVRKAPSRLVGEGVPTVVSATLAELAESGKRIERREHREPLVLHDREKNLAVGLSLGLWAFPLLVLLCLYFQLWWEAGDLGIVLLVQIKVFGPLAEH
jgi:hypothetical protein